LKTWHFSNFYFFYFITVGIIVPYWGLYLQSLGFTATEIGQLMAILLVTKIVAPNIWASVADHVAIKKGSSLGILKFATAATLIVYCMLYLVESFWMVGLVMFGYCVFWNACLPQIEAATLNHLENDRDKYGGIRLWGSIGFICIVLGMGVLMDHYGPELILPAGAISLFTLFVASVLLTGKPSRPSNDVAPELTDKLIRKTDSDKVPVSQLLNKRVILLFTLCVFMQLSHAPFYTFFSIYLEGYGYSKFHIGVLWSVGVVFEIGIFLISYKLLRRFSLTHLLTLTFLVAGIRWCVVAIFPESSVIMFATQIMHALTYGLNHSVLIQMIDRMFKGRYQVRGQALYNSVTYGVGGAMGSILSGYIWTYFGQNVLFLGAGIMMLVVGLLSFLFLKPSTNDSRKTG